MEEQKEGDNNPEIKPKAEVITLTAFESQISELEELVKDYANLVVTKENYKESNEKRLVLYRKRIAIQRDEEKNDNALKAARKINSEKANTLIAIIKPKEDDLAAKLKAIDDAEELAKQKELKRINDHKSIINSFGQKLIEVMKITDIEVLEDKKVKCLEWHDNYQAEEFEQELEGVVQSYVDTIDGLVKIINSKKVEEPVTYSDAAPKSKSDLVDFGEETPYIAKPEEKPIPRMFADHPRPEGFELPGQIPASQRPAFGGSTERVVLGANNTEPTLEERAKSGEFMSQVAANLVYGGYRFYIDTTLDMEHKTNIQDFIKATIDHANANEEAF
jgi:hypothetical protein